MEKKKKKMSLLSKLKYSIIILLLILVLIFTFQNLHYVKYSFLHHSHEMPLAVLIFFVAAISFIVTNVFMLGSSGGKNKKIKSLQKKVNDLEDKLKKLESKEA